jgi:hypothetical protein
MVLRISGRLKSHDAVVNAVVGVGAAGNDTAQILRRRCEGYVSPGNAEFAD